MNKKKSKTYTSEQKARVALEAIRGDLTINEISSKYHVHSTQIARWKSQALAPLILHESPEIFNTDQGVQFTCDNYIKILLDHQIQISMDGRGRGLFW